MSSVYSSQIVCLFIKKGYKPHIIIINRASAVSLPRHSAGH